MTNLKNLLTVAFATVMISAPAFANDGINAFGGQQERPGYGGGGGGWDRGGGRGPGRGGDWGRGPGRGPGRGGDWDRGPGRGPGRPGPGYPGGPGPGRPGPGYPGGPGHGGPGYNDLCQGVYVGSYGNGASAVFNMIRNGFDTIHVTVTLNGREVYQASGQCQLYGNQAQFVFTLHAPPIVHRGTISQGRDGRAYIQGSQDGGFAFQLVRQ